MNSLAYLLYKCGKLETWTVKLYNFFAWHVCCVVRHISMVLPLPRIKSRYWGFLKRLLCWVSCGSLVFAIRSNYANISDNNPLILPPESICQVHSILKNLYYRICSKLKNQLKNQYYRICSKQLACYSSLSKAKRTHIDFCVSWWHKIFLGLDVHCFFLSDVFFLELSWADYGKHSGQWPCFRAGYKTNCMLDWWNLLCLKRIHLFVCVYRVPCQ